MIFIKVINYILIAILSLTLACAVNPVTGKKEFMLLSEADEIKLGAQSDQSIVQMYGVYDSPDLKKYLDDLGQKMVTISHRPQLKFEFKLMDSPVINAFAVPGGYVYITRGIMAYLNSEAELAGVVGHEIGHVTARHSAKQYSNAQIAQVGLGLGQVLAPEFAHYAGLAAQGIQLLFLRFSRDNERQSDDLGVEYSMKVGYDAHEMSNFFATLNKMRGEKSEGGLPDWFSTHPDPADRVVDVRKKANEWQQKLNAGDLKINRDIYLNTINGIIYGENPRQGFVAENIFYHPDMKFKFPVPAGWKLTNLPTQVQILSGDEQAAILFTLAAEKSAVAAMNSFLKNTNARVLEQKAEVVNGFNAQRTVSILSGQSGPLQVMSYFIEKDKMVFVFHGFTKESVYKSFESSFVTTMSGFSVLKDKNKLATKPERIRIRKVTQSMNLRETLIAFNVPEDRLTELALINGRELTDTIDANSLIKTIEK